MAATAAHLPGPGRRRPARRADRPGHGRQPAQAAAGQAGVRAPAHQRERPTARPARGGRDRGRLRPVRPRRPRRGQAVPRRPLPHRPRHQRRRPHRRSRRRPLPRRKPAAGRQAHHLPGASGLGDLPAHGPGPGPHAPYLRHRSPRRGVPVHQPGPPARRSHLGGGAGRCALRLQHRLPRARALGPVRAGQPQLRCPGPLRRRQVLPRQAGTAPRRCTGASRTTSSTPRTSTPAWPERSAARYVRLGEQGVRLNPFDLPVRTRPDGRRTAPPDSLVRRSLHLHTVLGVLLGELPPAERAVLDEAITATYARAGITEDPRTWTRPAPVLDDLATSCGRRPTAQRRTSPHGCTRSSAVRSPACSTGRPPPARPVTSSSSPCATCPTNSNPSAPC